MGAQAQVTFNDNAAKLMLIALAQFPGVLRGTDVDLVRSVLAALLIAPFVLFSPMAGWLNDRFAKSRVLNVALGMQFTVMVLLLGALWLHSLWGAVGCFLLLALQATVFAPAKRSILRELVGPAELSRAVGVMEMLSVSMILVGGFAGGRMFDAWTRAGGDPWRGALITTMVLTGLSAFSWSLFQFVEKTKAQSTEPFRVSLLWRHGSQVAELWRDRPLLRATFGIMFFYGMGGYLYLLFLQMGADLHAGGGVGSGTTTGILLLFVGRHQCAGRRPSTAASARPDQRRRSSRRGR